MSVDDTLLCSFQVSFLCPYVVCKASKANMCRFSSPPRKSLNTAATMLDVVSLFFFPVLNDHPLLHLFLPFLLFRTQCHLYEDRSKLVITTLRSPTSREALSTIDHRQSKTPRRIEPSRIDHTTIFKDVAAFLLMFRTWLSASDISVVIRIDLCARWRKEGCVCMPLSPTFAAGMRSLS